MQIVQKLYKNIGETPLECIERFRKDHPVYEGTNMTYLGRLDPMAEGLLLVLAGDTRNKDEFLALDKTYEFEVLWGFETDTYDTLGLVQKFEPVLFNEKELESVIKKIKEKKTQVYPPYSSRTVGGRALYEWAREGRIDEVEIPSRSIRVFAIEHIHTKLESNINILKRVEEIVDLVRGDFRQKEIKKKWRGVLEKEERYLISKFRADVSSGTYIRSLAHEMGKMLGTSALAYSIKRTRVGKYKI